MRSVRMASSSLLLFGCILFTLFLHATPSKSGSNLIRVWIVGSPHTGALPPKTLPPELRQRAESLGYTIDVETFQASGFAAKFREALLVHEEPEVLTFDNYGVIFGIQTRTGWVEGIDSDRRLTSSLVLVHETLSSLQPRGWVMLVRSAVNHQAARALSMWPAECDVQSRRAENAPEIEPALRLAQEKAVFATRAYLDCDRSILSAISDQSRPVQQCYLPQSNTKIELVKACRVSGNNKFAIVSLVTNFSAEVREPNTTNPTRRGGDLGQQSILAVLRNQNDIWRLVAITHDSLNTVARIPLTNSDRFVNALDHEQSAEPMPQPAQQLTSEGVFPAAQGNERFGDFTWQPSPGTDVIGQVVEFSLGKGTDWEFTRLFFLPASENKISSGLLMGGGTCAWRVWSINKAGDVAFSEQHSFKPQYVR